MNEASKQRRMAIVVALVAFVAFLPSLAAGFVYDDVMLIVDNPRAHNLGGILRAFTTHFWDTHQHGSDGIGLHYYRPLVAASYVVNWVLVPGVAWPFHLFNVSIHAATVYLAARIASRWIGDRALGCAVALLFALHPTRSESVIWISGRTDLLMGFFLLLSIHLTFVASERAHGWRRKGIAALAILAHVAALLSKENAALLPLLLVVDFMWARREGHSLGLRRKLLITTAAISGLYLLSRMVWFPIRPDSSIEVTLRYGLMTIATYAERIVFPWPQTFFYRPLEGDGGQFVYPTGLVVIGAILLIGYLTAMVLAFRRDRVAGWLLLSAGMFIGPVLNFFYNGIFVTSSDHFLYLPLLLVAAGVASLLREPLAKLAEHRGALLAYCGILLMAVAVNSVRTLDYQDDEAMWLHELEVNPHNPVALQSLSLLRAKDGDLAAATELLERAVQPSAVRYGLLASDSAQLTMHLRLLEMQSARLADGAVRELEAVWRAFEGFLSQAGAIEGETTLSSGDRIAAAAKRLGKNELGRSTWGAQAAVIGVRIGKDARTRQLLDQLDDRELLHVSNPLNVVLAEARLGDFTRAYERLESLRSAPAHTWQHPGAPALLALQRRLEQAERFHRAAQGEKMPRAAVSSAMAMAELGAYLRALRLMRPIYKDKDLRDEVAPLYLQLLVAAGLSEEARHEASAWVGEGRANKLIAELQDQASPRLRELRKPAEPSPWWR